MVTHCKVCQQPIVQRERGRPRRYCSDACRYAEIAARKTQRPAVEKPSHCAICGRPIEQPKTGRPRITCTSCQAPRKPVQKSTGARARR